MKQRPFLFPGVRAGVTLLVTTALLGACTSAASSSAPSAAAPSSAASSAPSAAVPSAAASSAPSSAAPSVAASSSAAGGEGTLAAARGRGYVTLGFNDNKPLSFVDPNTGQPSGSGPVLLNTILGNLGIPKVHFTVVDFAGIIPGLQNHQWDLSGIAFYITPQRCAQVAFTNPVNQYVEGALVRTGNQLNLHSYADMAKAGAKVGIQEGDSEVDWAKAAGIKNIVLFPQEPLGIQALKEGRIDAYLNNTFSLRADLANYGSQGIELATPFSGPFVNGQPVTAYAGFAVRAQDVNLLNALNQQIAALNTGGQLLKLQEPFGWSADGIPPLSVTAKSLCPDASWAK